ncbi:MAG: 23S rRNA (adenine(2503)-C(2))-methyltransferase RlmN [Firmicutes bacterium]|nr:23S rRNA (adenine(2503)-C(2))-methyltransferase RlmN [Bacillota bacterium]
MIFIYLYDIILIIAGDKVKNIYSYTKEELENYFECINEKKFKATQVYDWLYIKRENNVDNWTNLKKEIRDKIKENFEFQNIKIIKVESDELARKYLFELVDGERIEAVLMYHDYGNSICVSSQVGCNMGCKFCESGRLKKVRNLETYEMVEQILMVEKDIKTRISSVVIMGIGEPFDNYDNVMNFIKIINDPKGIAIGARHITVSTSGIIPKIYEFMKFPLQVNLAISLHASNNEIRSNIMSVNKAYSLNDLLQAIRDYIEFTNRRVTIEYVMLNNVNDSLDNAEELAELLKGMNVYVNLIPYNETNHIEFKRSSKNQIMRFYDLLKQHGINVTIRKEFGGKISAACGQLRSKEVKK